jgi:hypothetical protein
MRRPPIVRPLPQVALAVVLAAAVAACGTPGGAMPPSGAPVAGASAGASAGIAAASDRAGDPTVIPLIVSTQQVVGPNRFVFSFLDAAGNLPAAAPERTARVAFIPPGATEPGPAVPATFVWAIEGSRGVYVAPTGFPVAGDWKAVFITEAPGAPKEAIGVGFQVQEDGTAVAVGERAPASDTPTAADVGGDLSRLSTDDAPDPAFYERSVADALAGGRPFVLVFATPAFCQSQQCGPTLDRVKAAAAGAPRDVAFINVEPYRLETVEGRLQPVLDASGGLQPVPAAGEWGLLTEPWIFAVDGDGIVRGSFEGVVGDEELRAAIEAIAGT